MALRTKRRAGGASLAHSRWFVTLACIAALVPAPALATYRTATGSYFGDGSSSRPITGLGFQPDFVLVKGDLNQATVARTATMAANTAKPLGPPDGLKSNRILSLDADGFTVGSDPSVNGSANNYYWTAFEASPEQMVVGSYAGNGADNVHVGVGFFPAYVIVMSAGSEAAGQRFYREVFDRSLDFSGNGEQVDRIQAFDTTGFEIGTDNTVNNTGRVYHYVAWKATGGVVAHDVYTGDGGSSRDVAIGFQPRSMLVAGSSAGLQAVERSDALAPESSLYVDNSGGTLPFAIRQFIPTGFRLGLDPTVNSPGESYYWVAFNTAADVGLVMSADKLTAAVGDTITYTLTLVNRGPNDLADVGVTDLLPAGLTYRSDVPSQGSYSSSSGLWLTGPLPNGATATLVLAATVSPGAPPILTNTASVTQLDTAGDPNLADNTAAVDVLLSACDLEVAKSVDDPAPAEGGIVHYTVTLTNHGPDDATGVAVTDALPAGLTYQSATPSQGSYTAATGIWSIGPLASAAVATLGLAARVDAGTAGTTLTNVARTTAADQGDLVPGNNAASAAVAVPGADLEVSKTVDDPAADEGENVTYTVAVTNHGPDPAAAVELTDVLPNEVTYRSHTTTYGSYDTASGRWTVGALAVDSSAVLTLGATIDPATGAAVISNLAAISGSSLPDPVAANNADRADIRTVEIETIPVGTTRVLPGSSNQLLFMARCTDHDTAPKQLAGVRFASSAGIALLRLWLDDGDRVLDTSRDAAIATGAPAAGIWDVTGLNVTLPVETTVTLFVTADVSLTAAPQGTRLGVQVPAATDLTWGTPAAVVTRQGFPLSSPGTITVADLVQAEIAFTPQPGDTTLPGSRGIPILQLRVPDDGGLADTLMQFDVQQSGTGAPLVEVEQLWLQQTGGLAAEDTAPPGGASAPRIQGARTWRTVESAQFFHTGAGRWSASGLGLGVPPGGLELRVLADIGGDARAGRTVQAALPTTGLVFASGRRGPEDGGWTNPGVLVIGAQRRLEVVQTNLAPIPDPVRRGASRLPVLGLGLRVQSAADDTLRSLRLRHTSTGPTGPAANASAEIAQAELWLDTDLDGAVGSGDARLAGAVPDSAGAIDFGAAGLRVPLPIDQQVDLVVTLTPDSMRVRDAEQLGVRLEQPADVVTAGGLLVDLPGPLATANPPRVDGQDAGGYDVVPVAGGVLFSGTSRAEVLDLRIPANGVDDDVLEGFRLENSGTADAADIGALELLQDDGDGVPGANDVPIGRLDPAGLRIWEASGLAVPLPAASAGRRFLVTVNAGASPHAGATFIARVPQLGITVTSGNDGPLDRPLAGGSPVVLSAPDRVTWLAGIAGSHAVRPDASRQPVLVLEVFNGYTTPQTLRGLEVRITGTARDAEYGLWGLYPDDDANGILDPGEVPLAVVSPQNGRITFSGFDWVLAPQAQQRLLVTYSLVLGNARDGSRLDAFVADATAFRYADDRAASAAAFPLDSPGADSVDGFVRAQVGERPLASRTLGGGETNVLGLDLLLPANGLDADTLTALGVELADPSTAGVLGVDFTALRLWRESDPDAANGRFDPAADVFLQSATLQGQRLQFANLSVPVAPGGQRFYVTLDTAADPTDGRRMQLVVPVGGVEMVSGDDGPIDASLSGPSHRFSSSALLASIAAATDLASRGQTLDVGIQVRNQGSVNLQGIVPIRLDVDPPGAATQVSGPIPTSLALAAGTTGSFTYRFRLDQTGSVRFTTQAGLPDSSVQSEPTTSLPVRVVDPPTGLALALLSTLPPAVNRGQRVTPLVWQLAHPDADSTSATIRIDSLAVEVEDAAGTPQPASAVLEALEIGSGGSTYARWTTIPNLSELRARLDPPLLLRGGQTAEVALTATIASQATGRDLRFRIASPAAVRAVDGNTGAPVTLVATLPWTSAAAAIHTQATQIAVAAVRTLPAAVNRGQTGVPAGRLVLSLPGAPDESEARIIRLAVAFADSAGTTIPPADLLAAFRVTSGVTVLLETRDFATTPGPLDLPLEIPVLIASGAAQTIDLGLDLRADTALDRFTVALVDSAALDVRDAPSGAAVSVLLQSPETLPWIQGPARVEAPAGNLAARSLSRLPASTFAGQRRIPVADVWLSRTAEPPGTAGVEIRSLTFRLLDDTGRTLVPADVVSAVRLLANGVPAGATGAPPAAAAAMTLALVAPLHLAPGDSLDLGIEADLSTAVATPWLRFGLEPDALVAADANDASRSIVATGGLPFATQLTRIVAQPNRIAFGPTDDPPVNVGRGTQTEVLALRILHPGAANQAQVEPESLSVRVRDAAGAALAAGTVMSAAHLRHGATQVDATLAGNRLVFDLHALPPLAAGEQLDLALWLDVRPTPAVADFRLGLDAGALSAVSGGVALLDTPLAGVVFPWLSPSVHLAATNLAESIGIYPNPFTPAKHPGCNLTFFLPAEAQVTAELYTLAGERVRSLVRSAPLAAGLHDEIAWDGRNGAGEMVRSGTYLLRLVVAGPGGGEFLRKLAVMR